ncbi:MAG: carboxypeptidase-like regulatory domain-containing protein, partial [Bacteroidetes bacterium]|nr:carboxypeptidase-like regulatory domain-containing protein [Bacteroidota bacterium]
MIILKRLLIVMSILCIGLQGFSQGTSGSLKGVLKNSKTGEPIPFANVIIEKGGSMVTGAKTNFNGAYNLKAIPVGTYDLVASCVGFTAKKITGVTIGSGIKIINLQLDQGVALKAVQVIAYQKELIDPEGGSSQKITGEELRKMPGRGVAAAAVIAGGVVSIDGEIQSIRGARQDATVYYIDGVKVIGSLALPQSAIEQVEVILGGLPPMYGDATGGVISVTTKGASNLFFGGVELFTRILANDYLDIGGTNMLGFNFGGPLFQRKDKGKMAAAIAKGAAADTVIKKPFISYFISGQYSLNPNDSNPVFPAYRVKQDVIDRIAENPMVFRANQGPQAAGLFLRASDLETVNKTKNFSTGLNLAGKLDVNTSAKTTLTFGGSLQYSKYRGGSQMGFNIDKPVEEETESTIRVHGRFIHRLSPDSAKLAAKPDSLRLFKNITYTIMTDYTKTHYDNLSEKHKKDFFNYGHVGNFKTYRMPTYEAPTEEPDTFVVGIDTFLVNGVYTLNAYKDTLYEYTPGTANPELSSYTSQYYDFAGDNVVGNYDNMLNAQQGGAILNGVGPPDVYQYYGYGTVAGGYGFFNSNQVRVTGNISVDIGKNVSKAHEVSLGFEHEKRTRRGYSLAPRSLWGRMRELANFHIEQLDLKNPIFVYDDNNVSMDTVNFNRIYNAETQNFFDYNLRKALGMDPASLEMLNTDEYDPDRYSLDMFSADEFINNNNSIVDYEGYDHKGNKMTRESTVDDYYVAKDDFGNFLREIPASQPIYSAMYIQDRFAFRDLFFTAGVRIDRFDNNRSVLRDKYSLFNIKEVRDLEPNEFSGNIPANIGDDYKVYVNDYKNPTQINGFRNGDTWYNASGIEVNSPVTIEGGTGINPYFVQDETIVSKNEINSSAFRDYVPQLTVSPRLSFSFPILDNEALFFAHYDILVQRPLADNNWFPYQGYLFLRSNPGSQLANPDLKPEKTIDYELGSITLTSNFGNNKQFGINYTFAIHGFDYNNDFTFILNTSYQQIIKNFSIGRLNFTT